ncbi:MAG TPA: PAS domain S-box protein [Longimicrobium sp.]|nr:PAS domain S-box protein [Longimicrobium sp.]
MNTPTDLTSLSPVDAPRAHALRVLLVEDDPAHTYLQRKALASAARRGEPPPVVTHAPTLAAALGALDGGAFDVILLDLMLPDSAGVRTVDAVREREGGAAIVVLTSLNDEKAALDALGRGAQDYLFKSEVDAPRLARALRYAVERKAAAAERAALQRLQATLDSLDTHVAVLDLSGRIVLVNEAWCEFGAANGQRDPAAGVGADYVAVAEAATGVESAAEVARGIRGVLAGRAARWDGEYPCHAPGKERWFHVRVTRSRDPRLGAVVAHENVTAGRLFERRSSQAEQALREVVERFALVQRATHDTIWDWDVERGTVGWNEEITHTFGYAPGQVSPGLEWWSERLHPDDHGAVLAGLHAALEGSDAWTAEYRFRRADGSYAVVLDRGFIQRGPDGAAARMLGSMQDVTEHRRLVAAVEQSESHYRRLVTTSPQTIYVLNAEGYFTEINPAGTELLQRPAHQVVGMHYAQVVAPDDRAATDAAFLSLALGETQTLLLELGIVRPSGEVRLVCIEATSVRENGLLASVHGIARDLTDERAREGHMRLLTAALENLDESVSVLDENCQIVYANAAHARMLGYPPGEVPPAGAEAFVPDEAGRAELAALLLHVREHGAWSGRVSRKRLDGRDIPVDLRLARVEQDGRPLVFVMSRDVSGEVEREQRLRRAERLASLGTLVSGVAHELNNPLGAIVGFTQLLLMDERPPRERDDLATILREAERMAKIVSDLRLLGRGTQTEARTREPVDLNDIVRHVLRSRVYTLRTRNVQVREELANVLPPVAGDQGQLEQVVLNLVVNAEQAVAGRGERRISVSTHAAGGAVSLRVSDTGQGIAPELQERIFDPFFTTKAPGEGTGLGLSVVNRIVAEHGGEIRVESAPGRGTTFVIDLPRAPDGAVPEAAPLPEVRGGPAAGPGAPTPLRVLVVDDEAPVRRVVARFLGRRGHVVDEAVEGGQALAMVDQAGPGAYDVILSDLRMPGLGGDQLLARLRARGGGLDQRLVFLTGDTASEDAERILRDSDVPVLEKPVDLEELARVLERVTGRSWEPGEGG